jgi:FAD:protein FMN transferase
VSHQIRTHRFTFKAMAAQNEILIDCDLQTARFAAEKAIAEVRRIEAKFSRYQSNSIISKINNNAGSQPIIVDEETAYLLNYADTLYNQSEGLFDITSGVLRRVWNFESQLVPTQQDVEVLLPLIGWKMVQRTNNTIQFPHPHMQIDFGGFGKEYAADRAAAELQLNGVRRALVNLAGDTVAFDLNAPDQQQLWHVGLQHPRRESGFAFATIPVTNGAVATSGDYERYFECEGIRYCHLLNPKTGWPIGFDVNGMFIEAPLQSISVVAPSCLVAGSLSTAAILAVGKSGLDWLDASGVQYAAVALQGSVLLSR